MLERITHEDSPLFLEKESKPSRLQQLKHKLKHGIEHRGPQAFSVFIETVEGAALGYSVYAVFGEFDKALQSRWGYSAVIAGALAGGTLKTLELNHRISEKKEHLINSGKVAVAGAVIAATFIEGLMEEQGKAKALSTIATGGTILLVLASTKTLLEIHKHGPFLHSKPGKVAKGMFNLVYDALFGLGSVDYVLFLIQNFGVKVPTPVNLGILGGVGILNVVSRFPIEKYNDNHQATLAYKLAKLLETSLFSTDITAFQTINIFNAITSIQGNTDIPDALFWSIIVLMIVHLGLVFGLKVHSDKKEEHLDAAEQYQEIPGVIDQAREDYDEEPNLEPIALKFIKDKAPKQYSPSFSFFKDCLKSKKSEAAENRQIQEVEPLLQSPLP